MAERHRPPPPGDGGPTQTARMAHTREAMGCRRRCPPRARADVEDRRFSSEKARREPRPTRPMDETIDATVDWNLELIADGMFEGDGRSSMSTIVTARPRERVRPLHPMRMGERTAGRRVSWGPDVELPPAGDDVTCLITGASSGIGAELARGWPRGALARRWSGAARSACGSRGPSSSARTTCGRRSSAPTLDRARRDEPSARWPSAAWWSRCWSTTW